MSKEIQFQTEMHYQDCNFTKSQKIEQEFEDAFLHREETDILSLDRMATKLDMIQY